MIRLRKHCLILSIYLLILGGQSGMALAQISLPDMGLTKDKQAESEYDYCVERWNHDGDYYDCDCIKENTSAIRQKMSDDALKRNQKKIANLENKIANARTQISKTDKAHRIRNLESNIASYEQGIAKYSKPTDPDSYLVSVVMMSFDDSGMCRSFEGARQIANSQCMSDAENKDKSLTKELCSCEADAVAQAWLDAEGLASIGRNNVFSFASRKARKACKQSFL